MSMSFGASPMTHRYGIDTSVLVRLLTGEPPDEFERCVDRLTELVGKRNAEIYVSNQVIGEAYVAVQHHYGATKGDVRDALSSVLQSGYVMPLGGKAVLDVLSRDGGAGLLDRLIALDHEAADLVTLTLDERMAKLAGCRLL